MLELGVLPLIVELRVERDDRGGSDLCLLEVGRECSVNELNRDFEVEERAVLCPGPSLLQIQTGWVLTSVT